MSKYSERHEITVVGIDLGKTWLQVCGQDALGRERLSKKCRPQQLKELMATLPHSLVGLEASARAHYWARLLAGYGHEVKLIAPQFVKPFVKSNKSDRADAEAICEAVQRPSMRFVGVKTAAQQDQQSLHRVRSLAVGQRTAQVNQVRGLLAEYGLEIGYGRHQVRTALPEILEEGENGLSGAFRVLLQDMYEQLVHLDGRIDRLDKQIEQAAQSGEQAQRLMTIPGVGALTATALLAALGEVTAFRNGRELAAWLGLVPRQHATGGKEQLRGISKRGDSYVRCLLIHGARAVLRRLDRQPAGRQRWLRELLSRRPKNVVTVALANRMARTAYALLAKGEVYQPDYTVTC